MKLNDKQRSVLIVAAIAMVLMFLYPPYQWIEDTRRGPRLMGSGWKFIWSLTSDEMIIVSVLMTEWIGAIIVAAILVFALKDN